MKKKFTSDGNIPSVTDILPHHDLVFRAPVCDPTYGLPIGNGDSGALLWLGEDTLHIQLNHTDLIDDIDDRTDGYCTCADEKNTVGVNGAQVNINFGYPLFDSIYQKKYEARLSLADATASVCTETPFGKTEIRAFSSRAYHCTVLSVSVESADEQFLTVDLKRFGSRTFQYWYSQYRDTPEAGLVGTDAFAGNGFFGVTQELHGCAFSAAAALVPEGTQAELFRRSRHAAQAELNGKNKFSFLLYLTVCVSDTAEHAREDALSVLTKATEMPSEDIYGIHKKEWADFWEVSYVVLPEDQDYPENLWYLNLYYANCEMKGKYPAHFCNGIWGFYHDFVPWNYYFHYNAQLGTFPLEAANHPELLETYYRFRREQLPTAEKFAREIKHSKGVFYTDVSDLKGRMAAGTSDNCTCGAQIAMGMLRHYRYTGDEDFLRETALPVLSGVGEYYLDKLEPGTDGSFHIRKTQGYEGSPLLDDSITDLSMIRAVFSELARLLPEEKAKQYREALEALAPFETADFLPDELAPDGTIVRGIGRGMKPLDDKVLSVGRDENNEPVRKTYADPARDYYGFPDTEMAPLFPSGITGLREKDSALFRRICNSVYMHHEVSFKEDHPDRETECCMGWCMMPIYLARMGLSEQLARQIKQTIEGWLRFPQGFGLYTPSDRAVITQRFLRYPLTEMETDRKTGIGAWNFRHFDYETLPIIACSVNEMLLQSFDGTVRLFPAVRKNKAYAFRLMAEGGFLTEAVYDKGLFSARIRSSRGGVLCLTADNISAAITIRSGDGKNVPFTEKDGYYTIETVPGQELYIANTEILSIEKDYSRNEAVKRCGSAALGGEADYSM